MTFVAGAVVDVVIGAWRFSEELMSGFLGVSSTVGGAGIGAGRKSMPCWDSAAFASEAPWMSSITSRASLRWARRFDGCCSCSLMIFSISGSGIKVKSRRYRPTSASADRRKN